MKKSEALERRIEEIKQSSDLEQEPVIKEVRGLYFQLGRAHIEEDDLQSAVESFSIGAREFQIPSAEEHVNQGKEYFHHHNDPDKALEEFQKAVEIDPNSFEAYHSMGEINLASKHDLVEAVKSFKKAEEIMPLPESLFTFYSQILGESKEQILSMKELAGQMIEQGQLQDAFDLLLNYLQRNPLDEEAYLMVGGIRLNSSEPILAAGFGLAAVIINPDNMPAHGIVIAALLGADSYDDAIAYAEDLAEKKENESYSQHLLGYSIGQKLIHSTGVDGKLDENDAEFRSAIANLNKAIKLYREQEDVFNIAETHSMLGELYLRAHNLYSAAKEFTIAKKYKSEAGIQRVQELLRMKDDPDIKRAIDDGYLK